MYSIGVISYFVRTFAFEHIKTHPNAKENQYLSFNKKYKLKIPESRFLQYKETGLTDIDIEEITKYFERFGWVFVVGDFTCKTRSNIEYKKEVYQRFLYFYFNEEDLKKLEIYARLGS